MKILMADNRPVRGEALTVLKKAGEIIIAEDEGEDAYIQKIKEIDPDIMVVGARKTTEKVLAASRNLKGVIVYGISYDFVDVKAATNHGIIVSNTAGVISISVAEFTIGLIMATMKQIPQSYEATKKGGWTNMTTFRFGFSGNDIYKKTVGIVGLGNIGTPLAKILNAMDARVISYTKHPSAERAKKNNVEFVDLETLMSTSDVVVLCCELTEETRGLIDKKLLQLLKPTTYFVNMTRSAVYDEEEMLRLLKEKKIAGAALDILMKEPNPDSSFYQLNNTIVTPHIAARTIEAAERLEMTVAQDALRLSEGKIPLKIVNQDVIGNSKLRLKVQKG